MASRSELSAAVALFRSLADPTRLAVVRRLAAGEPRVTDLVGEFGLAQSTVSAHLACLRDCGLVGYRAQGRQSYYYLARPELLDLLASAEAVLAATGEAVALRPVYGASRSTKAAKPGRANWSATTDSGHAGEFGDSHLIPSADTVTVGVGSTVKVVLASRGRGASVRRSR